MIENIIVSGGVVISGLYAIYKFHRNTAPVTVVGDYGVRKINEIEDIAKEIGKGSFTHFVEVYGTIEDVKLQSAWHPNLSFLLSDNTGKIPIIRDCRAKVLGVGVEAGLDIGQKVKVRGFHLIEGGFNRFSLKDCSLEKHLEDNYGEVLRQQGIPYVLMIPRINNAGAIEHLDKENLRLRSYGIGIM